MAVAFLEVAACQAAQIGDLQPHRSQTTSVQAPRCSS